MALNIEKVSMYGSIAGIPILIADYASGFESVRQHLNTGPQLTAILGGIAVLALVVALGANAVLHHQMLNNNIHRQQQTLNPQAATDTNVSPVSQLQNIEAIYSANDGPLMREVYENLRGQMEQSRPPNRENYLLRGLTLWIVIGTHEITWLNIFGSQLRALNQLNSRSMTYEQMRRYYEEGVAARPEAYQNRPFELWLQFLRTQTLIREDGDLIQITVRGRDFLRYLVLYGYDQGTRVG